MALEFFDVIASDVVFGILPPTFQECEQLLIKMIQVPQYDFPFFGDNRRPEVRGKNRHDFDHQLGYRHMGPKKGIDHFKSSPDLSLPGCIFLGFQSGAQLLHKGCADVQKTPFSNRREEFTQQEDRAFVFEDPLIDEFVY